MSNNIRQLFVFCLWAWRKNCHVRENVPNEFYYLIIHYRTNATVSLVMVQCISMKPIHSTLSSLSSPPSLSSSSLSSSVQPSTKASFIMTQAKAHIDIGQRKWDITINIKLYCLIICITSSLKFKRVGFWIFWILFKFTNANFKFGSMEKWCDHPGIVSSFHCIIVISLSCHRSGPIDDVIVNYDTLSG